jgi:hypothetical protein
VARVVEWLSLANRILVFAQRLLDTAEVPVTPQGARDARVIALALVARTISNLKGALGMIEAGQIIEARALARCCWENLFWAAALTKKGDEFVRQVVSDDAFSRVKRGKRLMNWSNEQETPRDFEAKLETFLDGYAAENPDRAGIQHAAAAEAGGVKGGYIIYGELSTDAAHPSALSLSRHVSLEGEQFTLHAVVPPEPDEIEQTLEFGCSAILGVTTAANQMLGSPIKLNEVFDAFIALSNKSKK